MEFDGIVWDDGNWPKCGKHGLSKEQIERILREDAPAIFPDPAHSGAEERFLAIGRNVPGHAGIFIGFTVRLVEGRRLVRPITARYMHAKEASRYDK